MNRSQLVQHAYVVSHILEDDGQFPNNSRLPLLIYKGAMFLHPVDEASVIENLFSSHNWTNSWVDGVFDYHHYHSTTHEVLGVFSGTADIQLGGPEGVCIELVRGDVMIIPAGVAHKCLKSSHDFSCVGAYPDGHSYDMNYGKPGERPQADENIKNLPVPEMDPVYGAGGHLKEYWNKKAGVA